MVPRPYTVPPLPVTLKNSCLTSWSFQNTLGASAHKAGNNLFRDKKQPTGTWNLYEDAGPQLRGQHGMGIRGRFCFCYFVMMYA